MKSISSKGNNFQKTARRRIDNRRYVPNKNKSSNQQGVYSRHQLSREAVLQIAELTKAFRQTPPKTQTELLELLAFYIDAMPAGAVRKWLVEFEGILQNLSLEGVR